MSKTHFEIRTFNGEPQVCRVYPTGVAVVVLGTAKGREASRSWETIAVIDEGDGVEHGGMFYRVKGNELKQMVGVKK